MRLGRRHRPLFLYIFIIPNLVAFLYFGLIASPVFTSRASLIILNPSSRASSLASMLSGGSGDGSSQGAFILKDFVQSWTEFRALERRLQLGRHYADGDFISAYGGFASGLRSNDVALWRYYKKRVSLHVDVRSGIASLEVQGYQPQFAQTLARGILADAVDHLNRMTRPEERALVENAEKAKAAIEQTVRQDERMLGDFRSAVGIYDPKARYESQLSLENGLIAQKTQLQSQYDSIIAAAPKSPDARNISTAMATLQKKIGEADRATKALERSSARYDELSQKRDNDVALLNQASLAAQDARQKAAENRYYFDLISAPSTPETPELPHRLIWIAGVFAITLIAWALLR